MKNMRAVFFIAVSCLLAAPAFAQITGGTCSASTLSGTYSLSLSGRAISAAGSFAGSFQGIGTITFDGQSKVSLTGVSNTNAAAGKQFTYSGTYTLASNCSGTITLTTGSTATFAVVVWASGQQYNITGSDATYIYSGSGTNVLPAGGCAASTLSGPYTYDAQGFTLSGTTQTGSADEAGLLQFDGQGNVAATYTQTSSGTTPLVITANGTYSVTSACLASATLMDSAGKSNTLNFVIESPYGQTALLLEANSGFIRTGAAHSSATNPTQSITNAASYTVNATPPGSIFTVFGIGLATGEMSNPGTFPLPQTLRTTQVLVNGSAVPLFYVNTGQINAQMPWEIPAGTVATVVVKNGSNTSNATAVYVPSGATPGIILEGGTANRAVVINKDNNLNSPTDAAAVGDEVVLYFLGGGPVQNQSAQVTGKGAPLGLSPSTAYVSGNYSITVGGVQVPQTQVEYIGLTGGSVGLYQANFTVPNLPKGTYPVVLTIGGVASSNVPVPVMTISN